MLSPLILVLLLLSLYGAVVKHYASCWVVAAVLFVVLLTLSIYLIRKMVGTILYNHRRLLEHRRSGKIMLSFHESLVTRIITDGFQQTTLSVIRFTLHCILQWTLYLIVLLAIVAAFSFDFRVFLQGVPKVLGLGIGIGCFVGILIKLFGSTLEVVEGVRVSLNIPGTMTYAWSFNEIASSRVVPVRSSRIAIEIDFTTSRKKLSSIRFVTRASISEINDLRRILELSDSTAT